MVKFAYFFYNMVYLGRVFYEERQRMIQKMALIAALILPLCNIPLIVKIIKRKSSEDISIIWVLGVWICIVLMAPEAFHSTDKVWKVFNIVNLVFFTAVVISVFAYRKKR